MPYELCSIQSNMKAYYSVILTVIFIGVLFPPIDKPYSTAHVYK